MCHVDGKVTFVDGALPSETVTLKYKKRRKQLDEAEVDDVLTASSDRMEPRCEYFGYCGGCRLQHMSESLQVNFKQNALIELLGKEGVVFDHVMPPLTSNSYGYRSKARLSVRHVIKKEKVCVGFRELNPRYVADMDHCHVLTPIIDEQLTSLSQLISSMDAINNIPQIEVACGDKQQALIVRHLEPLSNGDVDKLREYAKKTKIKIFLQPKGLDTIHLLHSEDNSPLLQYELPDQAVELLFMPQMFTQVNHDINRKMMTQALQLLELTSNDSVLDLFCGIGNFTLPIAKQAKEVIGVELDDSAIQRAKLNAVHNDINNTTFHVGNLFEPDLHAPYFQRQFNKLVLDPPRAGAKEIIEYVHKWNPTDILYVSCNPATLARDARSLQDKGYRLKQVGIMDMFPHTKHVESMALFTRDTTEING